MCEEHATTHHVLHMRFEQPVVVEVLFRGETLPDATLGAVPRMPAFEPVRFELTAGSTILEMMATPEIAEQLAVYIVQTEMNVGDELYGEHLFESRFLKALRAVNPETRKGHFLSEHSLMLLEYGFRVTEWHSPVATGTVFWDSVQKDAVARVGPVLEELLDCIWCAIHSERLSLQGLGHKGVCSFIFDGAIAGAEVCAIRAIRAIRARHSRRSRQNVSYHNGIQYCTDSRHSRASSATKPTKPGRLARRGWPNSVSRPIRGLAVPSISSTRTITIIARGHRCMQP